MTWRFVIVALLASSLMSKASGESNKPKWKLIWEDNFAGKTVDEKKWTLGEGSNMANNELEVYTKRPKNVRIENHKLVLEAHKEEIFDPITKTTMHYSSGSLDTKNKFATKYGRFEIRAKLPIGKGMWPAGWMMPDEDKYGGWPLSGEIDIMEQIGDHPETNVGTIHYGPSWPNNQMTGGTYSLEGQTFNDDFHVYAIEWEPTELRWYVDGVLYSKKTPSDLGDQSKNYPNGWPYDQKFMMILNLAVGGNWPGAPDEHTVFPQKMYVDYVRVYEAK